MKKILLIAFVVFVTNTKAQTPYVAIPDSNFVHYLKTIVPTAFKGDSLNTSSTLVTTTTHTISCAGYGISNLDGLQYFTSLTYLDCSYNNLTSLPALPNSLQLLGCNNNFLSTLPALPNSLQMLQCNNNNISCFPTFPNSITSYPFYPIYSSGLYIDPNPYTCFPNYINAMDSAQLATPLCAAGNSYSCAVSSATCTPAVRFFLNPASASHNWNAYPAFSANTTSVKWYWGDGSSTTGLHPSHTYSVAGTYTICVAAYSACGDSAVFCQNNDTGAVYINVLPRATTGIEQVPVNSAQVMVYPNPNNGLINLSISPFDNEKICSVEILNLIGECVHRQIATSSHCQIDLSNLNDGVYFLRVETNEGMVSKKIIKQ